MNGETIYTIDRFEGDAAVCEDEEGNAHDIPRVLLPNGTGEGEVIRRLPDGTFCSAPDLTKKKREAARRLFEKLLSDR